jgi:2-polyprenyl-3-methyl-5-hydroxy-6-metoxy-1,4-benzoquinol methylase
MLMRLREMWGWASGHRLSQLSAQVDQMQRETRLLLGALSLPPVELWRGRPPLVEGAPAVNAINHSTLCRQDSFEQPYFSYWARRVGAVLKYHRKIWEYVFICQALWEREAIRPGASALGFGIGRDPMAAFFAAEGCVVTATDMAPEAAAGKGWAATAQHAASLETLRYPQICPNEVFDRNVTFRVCDMNEVPADLCDFDFCWSACALEHLGSIEHGLAFIERSVECLKPGGWAVHTTEYNVTSNNQTVSQGSTVLFRRRDMEELAQRLEAKGHRVAPFDFDPGMMPLDRYIDVAPYRSEPHLKLALEGFTSTSFGVIVQKSS